LADFTIPQGQTTPAITAQLLLPNGALPNLTGATVQFTMQLPGSTTYTVNATATITDPINAWVSYQWVTGNTALPGTFNARWVVTYPNSTVQLFPALSYLQVQVVQVQNARTLYDLVRTVSINIGDLEEGTVGSGSTSTSVVDTTRSEPDGWWTGGTFALPGAPANVSNFGAEVGITGWTRSTGTWNTNSLPAAPSVGDKYEIRRIKYHSRAAIKEFLRQALSEVRRMTWIPVDSRADLGDSTTYAYNQLQYQVPAGLEMLHSVQYLDIRGSLTVTSATLPSSPNTGDFYYLSDTQSCVQWNGSAWLPSTVIPWVELNYDYWTTLNDGSVLIQELQDYRAWDPGFAPIPDGAPLRFKGSRRPIPPVQESDPTEIEGNYAECFATARMALRLAKMAQDQQDFSALFKSYYQLESDAFRGTRRALPSGSRKVVP
jgi:hypothetical protein